MVKIASDEELRARLAIRPPGDAQIIAQRAALRVFPTWGSTLDDELGIFFGSTVFELLRPMLTAGVQVKFRKRFYAPTASNSSGLDVFALSAAEFRRLDQLPKQRNFARFAAFGAALTSTSFTPSHLSALVVKYAADAAQNSELFWAEIRADLAKAEQGFDLFGTTLWSHGPTDLWRIAENETISHMTQELADRETFWHRWWNSLVDGNPIDWNLQLDVALIPDGVWQEGPMSVMAEIAKIEERHALKAEVAALREQLQQFQTLTNASAAHRSHNQPPDLIDDQAAVAQQITVIVNALVETEAELALPEPSASTLQRLAEVLLDGAMAIVRYCGRLADKALVKAAEELGSTGMKWTVGVVSTSFLTQNQAVQDIAKAILSFAAK